jgi:hypothetical protein
MYSLLTPLIYKFFIYTPIILYLIIRIYSFILSLYKFIYLKGQLKLYLP